MITSTWLLMILRMTGRGLYLTCQSSLMKKRQLQVMAYSKSVHFKVIFLLCFCLLLFFFCSFYNFVHLHTNLPWIVLWLEKWLLINPIVFQGRSAHAEEETSHFKEIIMSWWRSSLLPAWRNEIFENPLSKGKIFEICSTEPSVEP